MSTLKYFDHPEPFVLEQGGVLPGFRLAYTTFGQLNSKRDNVVWVCHALTANSNVLDWWDGLFKEGSVFDPGEHFIICANMLGGCYGSTGPLSVDPRTGEPYYHDFPAISNLDIVKSFDLLRQHLGIERIHTIIGGSMGGQQALEWTIYQPDVFDNLVGLATNARHSAWGIAFNETQRMAISQDSSWNTRDPEAGMEGMKTARAVALISYRAYEIYQATQGDNDDRFELQRAASYQQYQGEKLQKRFNAFTYWYLSRAMDGHNLGRNRAGLREALQSIKCRCFFIGIKSDGLFPVVEQQYLADNIADAQLEIIESIYGHDGFLVETDKINKVLESFRIR